MFKLLTEENRQTVASQYAIRRAVLMLVAVILVSFVGSIGLLPSYLLSNARQNEVLERVKIMGDTSERGDETELQTWLTQINNKLQILSPKLDTERPSDLIEKVLGQKITGIRITGFSWSKSKNTIVLSLNGIALDRQTLIKFEDSMKTSKQFSEVTLPISNLVQNKDINFQMKLSPAKEL